MLKSSHRFRHASQLACTLLTLIVDTSRYLGLCLHSHSALAAEALFLRKQLALYQERHVKPRCATNATRVALVWRGRWFNWRPALTLVQTKTFVRWHRQAFRLLWRWKSRLGRPPLPTELQALIRQMTGDNPTWGQERMAIELWLKLGLQVSPRTVRKYMPTRLDRGPSQRIQSQRWSTFVRNHAKVMLACDFCVVVTATFRFF